MSLIDWGERLGKLGLVIADQDEHYLKRLGNYLMVHYPGRFSINLFSSSESLGMFLNSAGKRPDILLYSHWFPKEALLPDKAHTMIQLSDNNTSGTVEGIPMVPRFSHADNLVRDMLHIYSQSSDDAFIADGKTSTGIYAVFSASGGSGRTCVAAGLSMLAARRNLRPLYLNFENTPSTSFYFKGGTERTFSDVIYYLKEGGSNLAVKLEGVYCRDPASGVHFFLPPESACELEELSAEDMDLLLGTIRSSSNFDIVFIDLPAGLCRRNKTILNFCDRVINVCAHRAFSTFKKGVMERDPEADVAEGRDEFSAKRVYIVNRYLENMPCDWRENDPSDGSRIIIRESGKLDCNNGEKLLIDLDPSFTASLGKLLDCLAVNDDEICKAEGGAAFG